MPKKKNKKIKPDKSDPIKILVTGDVILDHNIYQGLRPIPSSVEPAGTTYARSPGGAFILFRILRELSALRARPDKKKKKEESKQELIDVQFGFTKGILDKLPADHHSYAVWRQSPEKARSKRDEKNWCMVEALGYGDLVKKPYLYQKRFVKEQKTSPDIVVLDDAALGFRSLANQRSWPEVIKARNAKNVDWVILKMSSPVARGDLFRTLTESFQQKLILILSIGDLRQEEVRITRSLSWERTAQDLITELFLNTSLSDLKKCRHLVVSFGSEGALWMSNNGGTYENHLIFDPGHLEGEWSAGIKCRSFGYISCLCAGLVNYLADKPGKGGLEVGIMSGLSAMRNLHQTGHKSIKMNAPDFPISRIAQTLRETSKDYSIVRIPDTDLLPGSPQTYWCVMGSTNTVTDKSIQPLYGFARRVALFGPKALSNIPYKRFGKLLTIDRSEIESLQGIQRLIRDYTALKKAPRPLSLAVFGPPGSGKSFGIKQIAKSIMGDDVPILEFNLSQFEKRPDELIGAFHQVRDKVLEGNIPVVFWDEFDSMKYFWLQYLLAPMQDGAFREGQIIHPIGKCIFVFAGGTSYTMDNFGPTQQEGKNKEKEIEEFKLLKGPDFVSRLSGYLNVLGPNRRQKYDPKSNRWVDDNNPADLCFPCRRALLVRSVLKYYKDEILDIDKGVLNALLEIDKYKHGARSLETILLLANRAANNCIRRSDLPPREQMELHVNYEVFMKIVKRDMPFKMYSEELAAAIHDFYLKLSKKEGWTPKYDKPYEELPDEEKAVNKAAAARIPEVLSHAGLLVVPESDSRKTSEAELRKIFADNMEMLAEAEHDGWMEQKYRDGWIFGKPRDDDKRIHHALIPYADLSETDKGKDRDAVKNYPDIVKIAGYKIVVNK